MGRHSDKLCHGDPAGIPCLMCIVRVVPTSLKASLTFGLTFLRLGDALIESGLDGIDGRFLDNRLPESGGRDTQPSCPTSRALPLHNFNTVKVPDIGLRWRPLGGCAGGSRLSVRCRVPARGSFPFRHSPPVSCQRFRFVCLTPLPCRVPLLPCRHLQVPSLVLREFEKAPGTRLRMVVPVRGPTPGLRPVFRSAGDRLRFCGLRRMLQGIPRCYELIDGLRGAPTPPFRPRVACSTIASLMIILLITFSVLLIRTDESASSGQTKRATV